MSGEPKTLTLTPGRRYLIREGSWTAYLEEVRVVARSKTGVYIEHESGNRRWHLLAYAGVGKWVIEEDLGPWNPHEARDEAAELRAAINEWAAAATAELAAQSDAYRYGFDHKVGRKVMDAWHAAGARLAAAEDALQRLAGGENEK